MTKEKGIYTKKKTQNNKENSLLISALSKRMIRALKRENKVFATPLLSLQCIDLIRYTLDFNEDICC